MSSNSDQVVSLFSGAGGFSYGFSRAGLKPACGAELNIDACETYQENVGSPCHNIDLGEVNPSFFRKALGRGSPFAIIGGPPCQGFSTAGPRNSEDPRNKLIFNYLKIVESLKPRWFIFENVEGLLTSGRGRDVAQLLAEFIRIGYSVRLEKVNLAAYGVPQTRKRVLIVGNSLGIDFDFPAAIYSYDSGKSKSRTGLPMAPTVAEALEGLGVPAITRDGVVSYSLDEIPNSYDASMRIGNDDLRVTHHWSTTSERDSQMYALLEMGGGMRDLPESYWHKSFQRRAFRRVVDGTPSEKRGGAPSGFKRLYSDRQSLTITGAASREFIHPYENRPLTPRECARLQSFPDAYKFSGSVSAVNQQIGNAVPPIAAEVLATHLQEVDGSAGARGGTLSSGSPRLLGFSLTDSSGRSAALQATEKLLLGLMQREICF